MVVETTKCCKPSFICDIPLVRGDCIDISLVRSDSRGCVGISLSEEVEFGFVPYPSSVRLIFVWLSAIPLSIEVIEFVGIPLVRG